MKFLLSTAVALLLWPALVTSPVQAQVYRWTDESGQIHFGSQPPHEQQATAETYDVQVSRPATPPATGRSLVDIANPKKAEEKQPDSDEPAVSSEEADKYCQQGQTYMGKLSSNYSRRFKDQETGEYRPLTDAEREREQQKARKIMDTYCKKQ